MRPNISTILALGLLCAETASAVAVPRHHEANQLVARHRRHRYGQGKGRNSTTSVATATQDAGTGTVPVPTLTGVLPEPTEILPGGGNDDGEGDDENSETSVAPGITHESTGYLPTGTAPTATINSISTTAANNDGVSTTAVPVETEVGTSPPIVPSSEEKLPAPVTSAPVETRSVLPIPATTAVTPSTAAVVSSPVTSAAAPASPGSYWKPSAGLTWQIQLAGSVTDRNLPVDVYDIDLFDSTPELISTLHANNKKVICYFSGGSFESWRPDAGSFVASDKGSPLAGWNNEWWLNTNSESVRTIMKARLDLAKSKSCDGVDPDNVDVYHNANGLGITQAQSVEYLTFLATESHSRGLAMGLKNGLEMVSQVLTVMDYQVNESCLQYNECNMLTPFINANKPVFHIEYNDNSSTKKRADLPADSNCSFKGGASFSSLLKNPKLDAFAQACTGTLIA